MPIKYRPEIDGLRSIAVLSVLFFHAEFPGFQGGFVGVDVFFVISGYLITSILIGDLSRGTFSFTGFYERRIRRIIPPLYLVIFACIPFAIFSMLPFQLKGFSESLVSVSAFSSNIYFWLSMGYFDPLSDQKPLLHTWSLGIEEQFYLFFPILILLVKKSSYARWFCFASVAVISLLISEWAAHNVPSAAFYLMPTRAWELLLGSMCVLVKGDESKSVSWIRDFAGVLGLIAIGVSIFTFSNVTPFPGLHAVLPTAGSALIILFATRGTLVNKVLSLPIFVSVGLISYSLYLWHQPLFAFARIYSLEKPSSLVFLALCFVSIGLAFLTWRWVETPFRDRKKFTRDQIFTWFFVSSVLVMALGFAGRYNSDAFMKLRFTSDELLLLEPRRSDELQRIGQCFLIARESKATDFREECLSKRQGAVMLIGDSHAATLYPALKDFYRRSSIELSQLNAAYCLPLVPNFPVTLSQAATKRCAQINKFVLKQIAETRPRTVILSAFYYHYLFSGDLDITYKEYGKDLEAQIRNLVNSGVQVVVIGGLPIWRPSLPQVLVGEFSSAEKSAITEVSANGVDQKVVSADIELKQMFERAGATYISVIEKFCNGAGECRRLVSDGHGLTSLTFDYGHLSLSGGNAVVSAISPALLQTLH